MHTCTCRDNMCNEALRQDTPKGRRPLHHPLHHLMRRLLCMARKLKLTILFIYFLICTLPFILLPLKTPYQYLDYISYILRVDLIR